MPLPITPVTTSPVAPVTEAEALDLKKKINDSLKEITEAKDWDSYMTMQDHADVEILEAKLKASLAVINNFLKTGQWEGPAGSAGSSGSSGQDAAGNFILDFWGQSHYR